MTQIGYDLHEHVAILVCCSGLIALFCAIQRPEVQSWH
jgi:hypothetical protein